MRFEKKIISDLNECYAISSIKMDSQTYVLAASEGKGECLKFSKQGETVASIWEAQGGTMSIVEIPDRNGEFLAIQNFYPSFNAKEATVVWVAPQADGSWKVKTVLHLPYVHRIDIITVNDTSYFLAAVLCESKQFVDDWSSPGKLYACVLPSSADEPFELQVIKDGITRHHGFCTGNWRGKTACYISGDEGVFAVLPPPVPEEAWQVKPILECPVSDIALVDIDGDGLDELVTIEPFHGSAFFIYKWIDGRYQRVYQYPRELSFAHVIWGGHIRGVPTIIGGCRADHKELFYIQCESASPLSFSEHIIDTGGGPSNIVVLHDEDRDYIYAANGQDHKIVMYSVT